MREHGIKFNCVWKKSKPLPEKEINELNFWRQKMFSAGLICADSDGVGLGNISLRIPKTNNFIVTGTGTGSIKCLDGSHYTKVISYDFGKNELTCEGPVKASAESFSHAAIYQSWLDANVVIHAHSMKLWKSLFGKVPTTSKKAAYGTPEMAYEIIKLFRETDVRKKGIIVMGGHEEGLLAFGKCLDDAGKAIFKHFNSKRH